MKKILLVILTCLPVFAMKSRQVQYSTGTPLPAAYSASNQASLILSEVSGYNKNLLLIATMNDVVCNIGHGDSGTAPTSNREVFLVASEPMNLYNVGGIENVFCKGNGVAKTAGWISAIAY